jgi:hypothetical protein
MPSAIAGSSTTTPTALFVKTSPGSETARSTCKNRVSPSFRIQMIEKGAISAFFYRKSLKKEARKRGENRTKP